MELPTSMPLSQRTPAGTCRLDTTPVWGLKSSAGSSALMRASNACPSIATPSIGNGACSPVATRICSSTRSSPVTASVTVCSTWRRVFISRKKGVPVSSSSTNSTVPTES